MAVVRRNEFRPDKLILGRKIRGLSAADLAKMINVSRSAISKYENGLSVPSPETFWNITSKLNLPLSFFTSEISMPYEVESNIIFRSMATAENKNRDSCDAQSRIVNKIYTYLKQYVNFYRVNLPDVDTERGRGYTDDYIEFVAQSCRDHWGLSKAPIINLARVLEQNGIILCKTSSTMTHIDAFSRRWKDRPAIFLAAYSKSAVRQRFDMAHELGHLLLHQWIDDAELLNPQKLKVIEKEADKFASCFLLPEQSFSQDILSIRLEYFTVLKEKWLTSIQCMILRAAALGYINEDQLVYMYKRMSSLGYRKNEPLDDLIPHESPSVMRSAVKMVIQANIVSKSDFQAMFELPTDELEELLFLDEGYLSEMSNVVPIRLKEMYDNIKP